MGDPRSAARVNIARLVSYLGRTQPEGVGYIIENVFIGIDKLIISTARFGRYYWGSQLDLIC
eukprot:scaffold209030_cov23-Prasinocladus_malaysianus.AAC.1